MRLLQWLILRLIGSCVSVHHRGAWHEETRACSQLFNLLVLMLVLLLALDAWHDLLLVLGGLEVGEHLLVIVLRLLPKDTTASRCGCGGRGCICCRCCCR